MTTTVDLLLKVHGGVMIPLADICDRYFACDIRWARQKAALNQLPVPTWRLVDSKKAPLMVRVTDLAEYIDKRGAAEKAEHAKSQL